MAKCEICGKAPMSGNNVPHSLQKTRRRWSANVQKIQITENGHTRKAYVCTRCMRTMVKTKGK